MAPEENKLFIQRLVEEIINRKNLDALNELVAANFVEHVPFPGQGPGREGLRYAIGPQPSSSHQLTMYSTVEI